MIRVAFFLLMLSCYSAAAAPNYRITPTVRAVRQVMPAVVNLSTEKIMEVPEENLLQEKVFVRKIGYSLGSGTIIDPAGLIITSAHVVRRAIKININLSDGKSYHGTIIAENDRNDIALLQINGLPPSSKLPTISLARPGDLLLGETVIVVGNPYGLGSTITRGVLSAKARSVTNKGKVIFRNLLQTDAAVYPGTSGGPLINLNGKMIGITTAILRNTHGIAFAIPVEQVSNIIARWLIPERFSNISLGIIPAVTLKPDGSQLFYLRDVIVKSPAWRSGLRPGMTIIRFNRQPITSLIDLSRRLWRLKAHESITITNGKQRQFRLTAEKSPPEDGLQMAESKLGLKLYPLTAALAAALHYPLKGGLVISDYNHNTLFEPPKRGDILYQLGDVMINTPEDIVAALRNVHYDDHINAAVISIVKKNDRYYLLKKNLIFTVH